MRFRRLLSFLLFSCALGTCVAQSSSSSSSRHIKQASGAAGSGLDAGTVSNGVYHNLSFAFSCKIPAGWVLRTEEMNAQDDESGNEPQGTQRHTGESSDAKVLLAAFSRPPQAVGQEINSSVVIAAESVAAYPGLKEAAQYFGPLTEVAKAQGFTVAEEPYEFSLGLKKLARSDFHKAIGSRMMHQSTLVMLARGYALSFTFIAGTQDDLEELIQGLKFTASSSQAK